ncbi:MAG: hypothetical protein U9Q84_03940 [Thermodesulfobacteriota bacterium]|nr:hypothetical protein [Thermodesulfobacteriota bacterium]
MNNPDLHKEAMNAMVIMNAAITNIRLYPPSSALISNSIDKAYSTIQAILEKENSLVFAESEKNLLIFEQSLNEKDQQRPQVIAFLELFLNFGIKTITFEKGLKQTDLRLFLELVSKKPEDVKNQGGMQQIIESSKLKHILIDHKVYVAMDKEQQILAGLKIKDKEIVKYIMGDIASSDIDMQKIKELTSNPEWVAQVFQSGLNQVKEQHGHDLSSNLFETFGHMIHTLNNIAGNENKEKLFENIAGSIADMDDKALSVILTKNVDGLLGDGFFDRIIAQIDDKKFIRLATKIKKISEKASTSNTTSTPAEVEITNRAYENIMQSNKEKRIAYLKAGLSSILQGNKEPLEDKLVMQSLPNTIDELFSRNKNKTAEAIIDRLGDGLMSDKPDVRVQVSQCLLQVSKNLISNQRLDEMAGLSHKLIKWIKVETTATPAYKQICNQLQNLSQALINDCRFDESNKILESFNQIVCGKIEKNNEIQTLAGNVLKNVATSKSFDLLVKEFQSNQNNKRDQAADCLASLGEYSLERVVDI